MTQTNNVVFKGLYIISWIIFVGLCIEAGAGIVNFFFSIYYPEMVLNLYQNLDLTELYKTNRKAFYGVYSFIIPISILKAYLFYIVLTLMQKMDLSKPFNNFVADKISQISYYTLSIGLINFIGKSYAKNLSHKSIDTNNLHQYWENSGAFLLMGAVIYIIATIFKKGVKIQNENDLTV